MRIFRQFFYYHHLEHIHVEENNKSREILNGIFKKVTGDCRKMRLALES
jgi:hypothetical protein